MLGEILAITAAVSWALSSISLRRALQTSSPLTTAFASVAVNAIVLWPVAIMLTPFSRVGLEGIIPLLFAGLMAPSLARLLQFMAVDRLGVALSTPLIETTPLFGAVFAVSILHEEITIPIGIGITIVVLGVMILGSRESVKLTRTGVVLALLSAVLFAGADIGRKIGIILVSSPFLGAAVGATFGDADDSLIGENLDQSGVGLPDIEPGAAPEILAVVRIGERRDLNIGDGDVFPLQPLGWMGAIVGHKENVSLG